MPAQHRSMPQPGRPGLTPPPTMSWRDSAACLNDGDPDAWFADVREKARIRHALATCGGCPVRTQCLDFAIASGERYGIWGGLTEQDRQAGNAVPVPVAEWLAWRVAAADGAYGTEGQARAGEVA
jgi:WhiB family transcriptional regulator, redox-sensing transcriptional regulator